MCALSSLLPSSIRSILVHLTIMVVFLPLAGCRRSAEDIVVVSRTLKKDVLVSTAVPSEFGTFAAASIPSFWVEGKVRNSGTTDARNVLLSFTCLYGKETKVLTAAVDLIPAGETVEFKTRPLESRFELRLKEEEPEVRCTE